ncbi:MAG: hypothetical protein ACM3SR_14855 [Ignavibacteriales bacterium]
MMVYKHKVAAATLRPTITGSRGDLVKNPPVAGAMGAFFRFGFALLLIRTESII